MTTAPLPGFHSPAAGFDEPFEMLMACHDRVERSLALLQRLRTHLHSHGADADARSAARDVLRYFDLAAPLHHEDEELHIFPPLLAHGSAHEVALVRRLQQDHVQMHANWAAAREPLQALAEGAVDGFNAQQDAALDRFCAIYTDHIAHEEGVIYPAAQRAMPAGAQAAMGHDMAQRRRQ